MQDKIDIAVFQTPEAFEEALKPPAREIGHTASNLLYLIFGQFDFWVDKMRARHREMLLAYQREIADAINKIPDKKLKEPELDIIGPAVEASKYYIEHDEIRKMFANLIANSMNIDMNDIIHPAYIEIVKQLTPLDAQNFRETFYRSNAICNLGVNYQALSRDVFYRNVFKGYTFEEVRVNSASIVNLERLGLMQIIYNESISQSGNDLYAEIKKSQPFLEIHRLSKENINTGNGIAASPYIEEGHFYATEFGKGFARSCGL